MITGLFAGVSLAFLAIYLGNRTLAIAIWIAVGMAAITTFWYLATDILKINW